MALPIGLHGDAGAFSKQDNPFCLSWNGLFGEGQTKFKRYVFTVIKKSDMTEGTLDAILRILAWSLNAMLAGVTPSTDWLGRALTSGGETLAGGYTGVMCQVRGDWPFYCELFGFPAHNTNINMCWMCAASGVLAALLFTAVGPNAGWRETRRTHESYLAELLRRGEAVPILFALCTGLRLECVMIDIMHAVDLGLAAHVVGNIFWELIARRTWGPNQAVNLEALKERLKQWYSVTKEKSHIRGKLTLERIRASGEAPKLSCKASACRHIVKFALLLAEEFNDGSVHDRMKLAVCRLLDRFYDIVMSASMFLTDAIKAELPRLGRELCQLYAALSAEALASGINAWRFTPKVHLFLHLCEWQAVEYGNPRLWWAYADEDLIGLLIEVAETCHPLTMAATALLKWLILSFAQDA